MGASDLHLDDFLLSGKFDLIAYADPDFNLEDSEDLDLGEPVEEKEAGEKRDGVGSSKKTDSQTQLLGQVKQEVKDDDKIEPGLPGVEASGSSQLDSCALLAKVGSSLLSKLFMVINNKINSSVV